MLVMYLLADGLKLNKHATKSILIGGLSQFLDKRFQYKVKMFWKIAQWV
jgi:hypothetical protein